MHGSLHLQALAYKVTQGIQLFVLPQQRYQHYTAVDLHAAVVYVCISIPPKYINTIQQTIVQILSVML